MGGSTVIYGALCTRHMYLCSLLLGNPNFEGPYLIVRMDLGEDDYEIARPATDYKIVVRSWTFDRASHMPLSHGLTTAIHNICTLEP